MEVLEAGLELVKNLKVLAVARAAAAEVEGNEVGKHPPRVYTSHPTSRTCHRQPRIPLRMHGPSLAGGMAEAAAAMAAERDRGTSRRRGRQSA